MLLLAVSCASAVQGQGECKARASRCAANNECCSNTCLPLQTGSSYKYCKEFVNDPAKIYPSGTTNPNACGKKDDTCTKASDCCSSICAGFGTKLCWEAHRSLRGMGDVDEDHHHTDSE